MIFWLITAGVVLALCAWLAYDRVVQPLLRLREAIHCLAKRDLRPVLLHDDWEVFRKTAIDVRKIAELLQQLDRQREDEGFSLRAILSGMVEGVLITDRFQQIRLVNDPLCEMFGFRQQPMGRPVIDVFRNHQLQLALEHTLSTGAPRQIEMTAEEGRHLEVYASRLNPSKGSRVTGAVVVFHDITAVRNLEMVRRDFVANVSHEFRTPLTIINGYIETLLDGALDDRLMAEKALKVMGKNGERLTLLIEDLLTISRMEHRTVHFEFQRVDLRELITHLLERLESMVVHHGAVVAIEWSEDLPAIEADPARVEQAFANLIENALRHGTANATQIRIRGRLAGDFIEVVIKDNGPGIPLDDQPHIFERFYRVHKDRSRSAGGTGLGLSIVKHAVLAHGGQVSVESTPGKGAAFTVRLPVRQEGNEQGMETFPPLGGFI